LIELLPDRELVDQQKEEDIKEIVERLLAESECLLVGRRKQN
jgi:hypothetical protein